MHALWKRSAGLAAVLVIASCAGSDVTGPSASSSTAETVSVSPATDTLSVGDTVRLQVTATRWRERSHGYSFATSDSTIASVDTTGLVTGRGAGTAIVSVTSRYSGSTAHVQIVVVAPVITSSTAPVATVKLAADTVKLALGDSSVLGFHALDASGQITWSFDSASVTWTSTVPSTVSVVRSGLNSAVVKGLSLGHSHIIVSLAGHADTCLVLVDSTASTTSTVSTVKVALNAPTLNVGQSTQAVATAFDSSGQSISGLTTTWSTSDTSVATISTSGLVTAKKSGSASVVATVSGKTGSATLTVAAQTAASISVSSNAPSISVGQSTQVTAVVKDASGNVLSTPVTWSTSSSAIATVSATGLVSGIAAGTATITASSGTVQGSTTINVTAPVSTATVAAPPELPRVYLNTAMPTVTGTSIVVPAGGDLQAAINQAVPGDEIVLQAGATYTGSFYLPVKSGASTTPGTGSVIVIRSSALTNLPEGQRVSPSQAQYMARIETNLDGAEVIGTVAGTAGWRLAGLEITSAPGVTLLGRLVRFGDGNPTQNLASQVPYNLVLDRSYVHAPDVVDIRRCVDLQSGASAVIDSYLSGCHSVGSDAQAIASWNGPGPYKIVDNYLEGSGENVMFGGANITVPNQTPNDIEVRGNYFYKPLTWKQDDPSYAGTPWSIKNLFELKMGHRILVEGNVFEQVWVNAQVGFALLLKTSNDQAFPTTDVTVRHNIVRGAAGAVNIAGIEAPISRVAVVDNLFLDIGTAQWDPTNQNGRLFQAFNAEDVLLSHNVGFAPAMFLSLDNPTSPRLDMRDNIVGHGIYGLKGSGITEGTASLTTYAPGWAFVDDVIASGGDPSLYPAGTYFAASTSSIGFANFGGSSASDYALTSSSPYKGKASDGTDIGINAATLSQLTSGVKR